MNGFGIAYLKFNYKKRILMIAIVVLLLLLQSCLYTTQHFVDGAILEPAQVARSVGIGTREVYKVQIKKQYSESGYFLSVDTTFQVYSSQVYSYDFRLGLLKNPGVFKGLEAGWHLEALTNPVSLELYARLGLPTASLQFDHAVAFSIQPGLWLDYSWSASYVLSKRLGRYTLFVQHRWLRNATQAQDFANDDGVIGGTIKIERQPSASWQSVAGLSADLPKYQYIPDRLYVQVGRVLGQRSTFFDNGLENRVLGPNDIPTSQIKISAGMQWRP
jgi:hypothetical protein